MCRFYSREKSRIQQQCMICPQRYYSVGEFANQYLNMFCNHAQFYLGVSKMPQILCEQIINWR